MVKALDLPEIRFRVCCFLGDADLARVALVSSDWYLASRELLWYHPKLRGRTSREIRSLLASAQPAENTDAIPLCRVGPQVKSLGFFGAKLANPRKDILYCVEHCPNITSLDLTGQPHRLRLVARIVERRPGIRHIRLRGYPSPPSTKRPLAIDEDDDPTTAVGAGMGVGGGFAAGSTDDDGVDMEQANTGGAMLTHHPNKKRRRERKSEEEVFEILKRLKSLQTLSLWTFSISVDQLVSFAQQARQSLVNLHLFPAKGISDDALLTIGANFPHLRVLSLAVESSAPFRDIETGGTITPSLTPDGLFSLSAASSPLLSPPPPPPTTAEGLVRFFRECLSESLQVVSLPRSRMTDEALRVLVARNKGLKTLQVSSCPLLSAHGLRHVLDHAEQLEALDYSKIRLFKWGSLPSASQCALEEHLGMVASGHQSFEVGTGGAAGGVEAATAEFMTEQDLRNEVLKVIFGLPFWTGCSRLQTLDLSSHCFFVQPPQHLLQPQQQQQHEQGGATAPFPPILSTAFFASPASSFALCSWPGPAVQEEVSQLIFAQLQQLTRLKDLRMDMIPLFPTLSDIERFATLPNLEYLNLAAIHGLEDPRLADADQLGFDGSTLGVSGATTSRLRRRRRRRSIWGQDQVPHHLHHHQVELNPLQQQHQPQDLAASGGGLDELTSNHQREMNDDGFLSEEGEEDTFDEPLLNEADDEDEDAGEDEEAEEAEREMALAKSKQILDKFLESLPQLKVLEVPYRPQAVRTPAFQAYLTQQRPGFRF